MIKILRVIPLIAWCTLIFFMSSQNAIGVSETKAVDILIHKLAHLIEYAMLYLFWILAFYRQTKPNPQIVYGGVIFVLFYGVTDEIHQSFNPTRSPRWYDVLIDTLGGLIGYTIFLLYRKINK